MEKSGIKIDGHIGTWYVIDECASSVYNFPFIKGKAEKYDGKMFLLESEKFGEDAPCLIVTKDLQIILEDVWNGFDDLQYL